MFKRTIFGVALAPVFAACVALTAYAVRPHDTALIPERTATRCEAAETAHVERPDAAGIYELKLDHRPAIVSVPAPDTPCFERAARG